MGDACRFQKGEFAGSAANASQLGGRTRQSGSLSRNTRPSQDIQFYEDAYKHAIAVAYFYEICFLRSNGCQFSAARSQGWLSRCALQELSAGSRYTTECFGWSPHHRTFLAHNPARSRRGCGYSMAGRCIVPFVYVTCAPAARDRTVHRRACPLLRMQILPSHPPQVSHRSLPSRFRLRGLLDHGGGVGAGKVLDFALLAVLLRY